MNQARRPDLDDLIRAAQVRYSDAIRAFRLAEQQASRLADVHTAAVETAGALRQQMEEAHAALKGLLQ